MHTVFARSDAALEYRIATYFRELRDLTCHHENFPHESLVLLWAWLHSVCTCASQLQHERDHAYVRMRY